MGGSDPFESYRAELSRSVIEIVSGIPMFEALSPAELAVVADFMDVVDVLQGDVVFLEGERGDYVCFVAEGLLEVSKKVGDSDKRAVITTLSPGHSIGEMALIDEAPRSATVVALADTRMAALTRQGFEGLIKKDPMIGVKLMKGISRLLSASLRKTSCQLAETLLPVV